MIASFILLILVCGPAVALAAGLARAGALAIEQQEQLFEKELERNKRREEGGNHA